MTITPLLPETLVITPPSYRRPPKSDRRPTLFLGGSIEMGAAEDWQSRVAEDLVGQCSIIYNPRRADWDSTWTQSIEHPQFNAQVHWEMDRITEVDFVLLHFEPATQSPITLGELYWCLATKPHQTIVSCPQGYWRRGNVEIMCERHDVDCHTGLDRALNDIRKRVFEHNIGAMGAG